VPHEHRQNTAIRRRAALTATAQLVPTGSGQARITWHAAPDPQAVLALGHGASTGIEAPDLQALAGALPAHGVTVALVEQPWRVAGRWSAPGTAELDAAWREVWPYLAGQDLAGRGLPVLAGGRSAGARVACRTARAVGAVAVLALSFPLHAPGRPEQLWDPAELLGTGLPTLIVQGGDDPFGRPADFPPLPPGFGLTEILRADHVFSGPAGGITLITEAVTGWLGRIV
jgi:predicted alpha/beta-hydrolase family hydrolase